MCTYCLNNNIGRLELIIGCMFAGKTEELVRRFRIIKYSRRMNFVIFKPAIDDRYLKENVVSHNMNSMKCVVIKDVNEIEDFLNKNKEITSIGIDELQFFDYKIVNLINKLVDKKYLVIACGLDLDYMAEPFKNIKDLMPYAEYITKLHAICVKCGSLASRTKKILKDDSNSNNNRILIGSSNFYEARCRYCYKL